jgi:hypothetical protein
MKCKISGSSKRIEKAIFVIRWLLAESWELEKIADRPLNLRLPQDPSGQFALPLFIILIE